MIPGCKESSGFGDRDLGLLLWRMTPKDFALKYDNIDDPHTYRSVGNIEYVVEESEFLSADIRQPTGEIGMYQRKIEHIDYLAM